MRVLPARETITGVRIASMSVTSSAARHSIETITPGEYGMPTTTLDGGTLATAHAATVSQNRTPVPATWKRHMIEIWGNPVVPVVSDAEPEDGAYCPLISP